MARMRAIGALLLSLAVITSACAGSSAEEPSTTTTTVAPTTTTTAAPTTTTTTRPTTTTTTVDDRPVSPINGMPIDDASLLDRRSLVIKIDNHPNARPQTGLDAADAVVELTVEGITRLVGVYHTGDAEVVGPIRSMRPTDGQLARLFDAPLVASGGQDWVISEIRATGTPIIGEVGRPQTFRSSSRRAPHNLYGDTLAMRDLSDARGYDDAAPDPIWTFGELPDGGDAATSIDLPFTSSAVVRWEWDGARYTKTTNGVPHAWITTEGEAEQMWAETLVVLEMITFTQSPPPGGGPAKAVVSIGEGTAYVFAGGQVVRGTWERPSLSDSFTLLTDDGDELTVPPGKTWIGLFDSDRTVRWSG